MRPFSCSGPIPIQIGGSLGDVICTWLTSLAPFGTVWGMTKAFPLRIRDQRTRDLIRNVAAREGISQNELLEQAAEHELIARGALIADELEASAAYLRRATQVTMATLIEASIAEFVVGEALTEPMRAHQVVMPAGHRPRQPSVIGAVAAFTRG